MKAVILAAGVGSRLRPLTSKKPKCLVRVAGRPILDYQVRAYTAAGIKDILIVVGYEASKIKEYYKHTRDIHIKLIENEDYEVTNNMYSLFLTAPDVENESFILSNGDVVFDTSIIYELVHSDEDLIAADKGSYSEEAMKITLNETGLISNISKEIPQNEAYGNSIDIYKFSAKSSTILFQEMRKIIAGENSLKDWTEIAIQRLLQMGDLKMQPFEISNKSWVEIDNFEDLAVADQAFSSFSLKDKKLCFIDLDGTIFLGNKLLPEADKVLTKLQQAGMKYYFLSNNSSRSKKDYVAKLRDLGIESREENFVLSTDGVIEFLTQNRVKNVYLVGTESMKQAFVAAGLNADSDQPEYVVLGYDTEVTYEKLKQAAIYLNQGADLLATHCDLVCPTPEGPIPDIGAMLALFEAATHKTPVRVFGKPHSGMVDHILTKNGLNRTDIVVIGDRLYTDMKLARNLGCDFVCVLSGETNREDIEPLEDVPDLIINSIAELQNYLE